MTTAAPTTSPCKAVMLGVSCCLAFWVVFVGACQQTRTATHGQDRRVMAGFAFGTLTANLPQTVSVSQVHAAAESVLLDRGYSIEGSACTLDNARVRARSRVDGRDETTTIAARVIPSGVRVAIEAGLLGDEAVSRALLDDLLARLGR